MLAAVMLAACLSGCAGNKEKPADETAQETEAAAEEQAGPEEQAESEVQAGAEAESAANTAQAAGILPAVGILHIYRRLKMPFCPFSGKFFHPGV